MSKNGDEPAYPRHFYASAYSAGKKPLELTIPEPGPPGLTKRELFEAMAMQGIVTGIFTGEDNGLYSGLSPVSRRKRTWQLVLIAEYAADIAEALLAKEPPA